MVSCGRIQGENLATAARHRRRQDTDSTSGSVGCTDCKTINAVGSGLVALACRKSNQQFTMAVWHFDPEAQGVTPALNYRDPITTIPRPRAVCTFADTQASPKLNLAPLLLILV